MSITQASHEVESKVDVYGIEFTNKCRQGETDISATGKVMNWEAAFGPEEALRCDEGVADPW